MRLRLLLFGLALCPLTSFAQTSAVEQGRAIYRSNCAFCHGLTGLGGRGPDLVGGQKKPDAEIKRIIHNGVPGTTMAAFSSLEEAELTKLVGFLNYLRGSGVGTLSWSASVPITERRGGNPGDGCSAAMARG